LQDLGSSDLIVIIDKWIMLFGTETGGEHFASMIATKRVRSIALLIHAASGRKPHESGDTMGLPAAEDAFGRISRTRRQRRYSPS